MRSYWLTLRHDRLALPHFFSKKQKRPGRMCNGSSDVQPRVGVGLGAWALERGGDVLAREGPVAQTLPHPPSDLASGCLGWGGTRRMGAGTVVGAAPPWGVPPTALARLPPQRYDLTETVQLRRPSRPDHGLSLLARGLQHTDAARTVGSPLGDPPILTARYALSRRAREAVAEFRGKEGKQDDERTTDSVGTDRRERAMARTGTHRQYRAVDTLRRGDHPSPPGLEAGLGEVRTTPPPVLIVQLIAYPNSIHMT